VTAAKTCDMATSAAQARDASRMAGVTACQSPGDASMTARQSRSAGTNISARQSTGAAKSATDVTTAEMAATHSTTKVATATKVPPSAMAPATAAMTAATATASEGLCLYRARSQSDNRKDDSNLTQHHFLHPGCSRILIFWLFPALYSERHAAAGSKFT
jgi:hypothetical protein